MPEMKRYYNSLTKEIVEYPEEAAALFDVLKPVPSEREDTHDENQLDIQIEKSNTVDLKEKSTQPKPKNGNN